LARAEGKNAVLLYHRTRYFGDSAMPWRLIFYHAAFFEDGVRGHEARLLRLDAFRVVDFAFEVGNRVGTVDRSRDSFPAGNVGGATKAPWLAWSCSADYAVKADALRSAMRAGKTREITPSRQPKLSLTLPNKVQKL